MKQNTASLTVGRLLEVRADAGYRTAQDVDAVFAAIGRELSKLPPGAQHVTVVDWRRCPLMSPEAAAYMVKKISGTNASTVRSAAIASDTAPLAVLQFVRLIRDANLPDRRLFVHADEACAWLVPGPRCVHARLLRADTRAGRRVHHLPVPVCAASHGMSPPPARSGRSP